MIEPLPGLKYYPNILPKETCNYLFNLCKTIPLIRTDAMNLELSRAFQANNQDNKQVKDLVELFYFYGFLKYFKFNDLVLVYYKDENDYCSFHVDSSYYQKPETQNATLSLGGTRKISFKKIESPIEEIDYQLQLNHGDLMIMEPEFQKIYQHAVLREDTKAEERYVFAFYVNKQ